MSDSKLVVFVKENKVAVGIAIFLLLIIIGGSIYFVTTDNQSGSNSETRAGIQSLTESGIQGATGLDGEMGPMGPMGYQGLMGLQGPMGVTGYPGPDGQMGPMGPMGYRGAIGPQGPIGYPGPDGKMGPTGYQGSPGPIGGQGPVGYQGPPGVIGPQGPTGNPGANSNIVPGPVANSLAIINDSAGLYYSIPAYWMGVPLGQTGGIIRWQLFKELSRGIYINPSDNTQIICPYIGLYEFNLSGSCACNGPNVKNISSYVNGKIYVENGVYVAADLNWTTVNFTFYVKVTSVNTFVQYAIASGIVLQTIPPLICTAKYISE